VTGGKNFQNGFATLTELPLPHSSLMFPVSRLPNHLQVIVGLWLDTCQGK
jgi:hypothetical protein